MPGKVTYRIKKSEELKFTKQKLVFQNEEKEKCAAELIIANQELAFQNKEKEKRAEELTIADKELVFQKKEKKIRAAELIIANKELVFQNEEKGKRAAELIIANKELLFQNKEKEKKAAALIIANKELIFQNKEKEKRAAALIIANKELAFQNKEKEKKAAELIIANKELGFQNKEKEKRAAELVIANKELKEAEEAIRNSLKELSDYKYALNESSIVAITDQKGIIKYANGNFCRISKYSAKELIGQDHRILNSGYHPKSYIKDLWTTIANGKIWKGEFCNKAKDGSIYWVDATIVPFLNKQGKPYQYLAIRRDITERKKAEDALCQSEETFRRLFSESADSILLLDDTGFIECNQSAASILGYSSPQDVLIKQPWEISPEKQPDGRLSTEKAAAMIAKALQQGYNRFEWVHTKLDGTEFPIEVMLTPIILKGKQSFYTIWRDITERKKAEHQKEFDSNNHKALLNNTNDLMWSVDRDLKLITCNESFKNMVKLESGKTITKGSDILAGGFSEEQLKRFRKYYERAFSGESFTEIEYVGIPDDFWSEISFYPIYNENEIAGTACFSRDITKRKKAEEKLKESNERYEFVNKATQDTIWEWDYLTKTGRWGEGIIKTFGYSDDKLIYYENWIEEYIHPYDKEELSRKIKSCIESGIENWQDNYRFRCADGTYKYVYDRGFILFDDQGNPYRMFGAMTDVTEKKRLERELVEQQIMQQKLITETTILAQEKERNELGRELHDNINQILATVKMYLGLAKSGKSNPEELVSKSYEYVDEAMNEIRKLSHSLVAPSLGDMGLKECLLELAEDINMNNDLKLHVFIDKSYNQKLTDKNKELMLYRIIQEQLNNIIKYAHAKEAVIKLSTDQDDLILTVSDDGVGFDTSKKSNGIGLKNIKGRIELYTGVMLIISAPGKGCTLEVYIPH